MKAPDPIEIEIVSSNAWPAFQTVLYDGWVLRMADGVTNRANSVLPLYPSTINIEQKIDYCEGVYRDNGICPNFRVSDIYPVNLENILIERGYETVFTIVVQTLALDKLSIPQSCAPYTINFEEEVDTWLNHFMQFYGYELSKQSIYKRIFELIPHRRRLISVKHNGQIIGCAMAVLEDRYVGLFNMVLNPAVRGQGIGKIVLQHILSQSHDRGARLAYLQVLDDNTPALNLYHNNGFRELYSYSYRRKKLSAF